MKLAVQLYSIRNYIKENGLEAGLKMVSEAGFDGVEFAGFYGKTADEILELLGRYNLIPVSAHMAVEKAEENIPMLKALNIKDAIIASIAFNNGAVPEEEYSKAKKAYKLLKEHGITLGYHNHAFEFEHGGDYIKEILNEVDGLTFEPDIMWLAAAGRNPVEYIKEFKDRVRFLHIKELPKEGLSIPRINPVVGEGVASCGEVMVYGNSIGIEWSILEIEGFNIPEREYLIKSYEFMKNYK